MLTDDDLTRELVAAFHGETDDLAYAGTVPTLRRRVPLSSLPVAAAAAAVVIVPQVTNDEQSAGHHPQRPSASAAPRTPTTPTTPPSRAATGSATPSTTSSGGPVGTLHEVHLAGFTFESTRQITEDDPLVIHIGAVVPDDAAPVPGSFPDDIEKVWVGTDAKTGFAAVWLSTGNGTGPNTFEIWSFKGDWTSDELTALVTSPVED